MAKRVSSKRRQVKQTRRRTNWVVIGGVVAVSVIALFALLYLGLRPAEAQTLAGYCQQNPNYCVVQGAAGAPVTIVEVSDYGCPACRMFHEQTYPLLVQQYVETGQVRYISFPYALDTARVPATSAALCANAQGAYYEFTDAMFTNFDQPDNLARAGFLRAAESAGLDMDAFTQCVDQNRYFDLVQANRSAARTAGVSATPTFFINDSKLEGAQPFPMFQQRIEAWLR